MKMIDMEKLKLLKIGGILIGVVLVLGFVFWIGAATSAQNKAKQEAATTQQETKAEGSELTQEYVKEFLTAYFNKQDLGENRNRYLPYMTEAAYNQEVNSEEEPTVQTYKGYVVDTQMKSAIIYIDQENNVALAQVRYTQTQLQKKYDYTNAQTNVGSSRTIRIRFSKQDGKYLVNHIDPILIVDSLNASEKASIPSLNKPITSTEGKKEQ
ncbi:hypothetical protein [Streptococcus infantis]|uniref:hypothetical protein n=1 Tax=Streptococcus infantis TaxID=68892 RepID=UPI001CBC77CC|nr:hypothetical protein [Streptococcus infantis]MBZ2120649.1 hypothetical protein [Streptococcus infantis]MBZ2122455.1 hypothetical protein [Streptococcus infantis]MBZ2125897.1 hypothetical protein [Streptococcus infantis]